MNKFIKIAAPLSLFLVSLCSCGSSKKVEIDLDNYTYMTFKGNDTVGMVDTFGIDIEKMVDDNPNAFGGSDMSIKNDVAGYFDIKTIGDETDKMTNGDIVTLDLGERYTELNEKYNVNLTADNLDFTVNGLKELEEIDPFENIQVTFKDDPTNIGGNTRWCTIDKYYNFPTIECKIDKTTANIGDTVTIEYFSKYDDKTVEQVFALEGGYKITRSKMEVVVE